MNKDYIDILNNIKLLQKNLKRSIKNQDDNVLNQLLQNLTEEIKILKTYLEELDAKNIVLKDVNVLNAYYDKYIDQNLQYNLCLDFFNILTKALKKKQSFEESCVGDDSLTKNFFKGKQEYENKLFANIFNIVYFHHFCYISELAKYMLDNELIEFDVLNEGNVLENIKIEILKNNPHLSSFETKDLITLIRNPIAHESYEDEGIQYLLSEESLEKHEKWDNKRKFSIFNNNSEMLLKSSSGEDVFVTIDQIDLIRDQINLALSKVLRKVDFIYEDCNKELLNNYRTRIQLSGLFRSVFNNSFNKESLRKEVVDNIKIEIDGKNVQLDDNEKECLVNLMINNLNNVENQSIPLAQLIQHVQMPLITKYFITAGTLTMIDQLSNYFRKTKLQVPFINMAGTIRNEIDRVNVKAVNDPVLDFSFYRAKDNILTFLMSILLNELQNTSSLKSFAEVTALLDSYNVEEKNTILRRLRNSCKHGNFLLDRGGNFYFYDTETSGDNKGKRDFIIKLDLDQRLDLVNEVINFFNYQYYNELLNKISKFNKKANKIINNISKKQNSIL